MGDRLYVDDISKNIHTMPYDEPYIPQNESKAFFTWVNMLLSKQPNKTPKTHYKIIDHVTSRHQREEVLAHRGSAKSTVVGELLPLYVATMGRLHNFGKVRNIVIFSATIDQAQEHLSNIVEFWDKSDALQQLVTLHTRGKKKAKVDEIWFTNKAGDEVVISAIGSGQSMRGTKKGDSRPELLIYDDILTDDILFSENERKKLKSWFYSSVQRAVDITHFKHILINTPMTEADLIYEMWQSEKWHTLLLPLSQDVFTSKDTIVSSWADRFTPEAIWDDYMEAKSMGSLSEFYREMMLMVTPKEARVFRDEDIIEVNAKDLKTRLPDMNFYTSMDFAVSEKQSADYRCIMTIAVDDDDIWYVVNLDHGRWNPQETLDILFKHFRVNRPIKFKAEKAALQQVLGHFIEQRMLQEGVYVNTGYLELNSKMSKHGRIMSLDPRFRMKKIKFVKGWYEGSKAELFYELRGYTIEGTKTKHDDLLDTLANFQDPNFVMATSQYGVNKYESDFMGETISDPCIF